MTSLWCGTDSLLPDMDLMPLLSKRSYCHSNPVFSEKAYSTSHMSRLDSYCCQEVWWFSISVLSQWPWKHRKVGFLSLRVCNVSLEFDCWFWNFVSVSSIAAVDGFGQHLLQGREKIRRLNSPLLSGKWEVNHWWQAGNSMLYPSVKMLGHKLTSRPFERWSKIASGT
jgi:hypothetical protein